jgi:hypothetical protein
VGLCLLGQSPLKQRVSSKGTFALIASVKEVHKEYSFVSEVVNKG